MLQRLAFDCNTPLHAKPVSQKQAKARTGRAIRDKVQKFAVRAFAMQAYLLFFSTESTKENTSHEEIKHTYVTKFRCHQCNTKTKMKLISMRPTPLLLLDCAAPTEALESILQWYDHALINCLTECHIFKIHLVSIEITSDTPSYSGCVVGTELIRNLLEQLICNLHI